MTARPPTVTFALRLDASVAALARRELMKLRRLLKLDAHPELTVQLMDEEPRLTLPRAVLQATSL